MQMRYSPVPCTEERLLPTRWIVGKAPDRKRTAEHLLGLRAEFGTRVAKECRSRMIWVGVYPVGGCWFRNKYGF